MRGVSRKGGIACVRAGSVSHFFGPASPPHVGQLLTCDMVHTVPIKAEVGSTQGDSEKSPGPGVSVPRTLPARP